MRFRLSVLAPRNVGGIGKLGLDLSHTAVNKQLSTRGGSMLLQVLAALGLKLQGRMDLAHHGGAFAYSGCDALRRACANITDRKYARNAGLQGQSVAAGSARAALKVFAGSKKSFCILRCAVLQPSGIRFGADEQKQGARNTVAWPAEFPPPTSATSSPSHNLASMGDAQ